MAKKKQETKAAAADAVLVVSAHCGVWVSGLAETVVKPGRYIVRADPAGWGAMGHPARLAAVKELAPGCVFDFVAQRVTLKGCGELRAE